MIVETSGDVIKLSGDLPRNHWETIRTAAALVLKKHPLGVVVDGSGITSCSVEGAETFYSMMLHIEKQKARIIVANLSQAVHDALKHVPEVRSRLPLHDSVEKARESLGREQLEPDAKESRKHATGTLILALCGAPSDSFAVAIAAAIAQMRQLRVVVMWPIVVPQSLPIGTPMPDQEENADKALQAARETLKSKDIPVHVGFERTRSIAAAIEKAAEEMDERTAVVALPSEDARTGEPGRTAEELLSKLSAEVILVREPRT